MDRVHVNRIALGLCHMQVCVESDATDAEILAVCNAENPSGTTRGWTTVHRHSMDYVEGARPCHRFPERLHLLVGC